MGTVTSSSAAGRLKTAPAYGSIQLVVSAAHQFENDERARLLTGLGFGPLDALHLAFAEQAQARWFVTTDDRLLADLDFEELLASVRRQDSSSADDDR